ncbi:uncharacterized protein LOC131666788 [Phymastichus coffea]|uniref:uncharacterized protein LOC131666788 n=1 Tax=Phymastichus coffea TaxID=108790 RepID=UPI00273A8FD5|nr:uncharacterized protein LOC131666788 [Phymastichus coffea]
MCKLYLPAALRRQASDILLSPAHPNPRTTTRALSAKFAWPHIREDTYNWARAGIPCQKSKISKHNRAEHQTFDVPENRYEPIHLDLITLPVVQNFWYSLTGIDRFTRWPLAVPLPDMTAETVASALVTHWISQYGCPIIITSDQDTQFEAALFVALITLL